MARIRKSKPAVQKDQNQSATCNRPTCAVVRHEKLCLRVDVPGQRLYGYAELKVVEPTKGVIGLHAHGLNVEKVMYDGVLTEYELVPAFVSDTFGANNCSSSYRKIPGSVRDAAESAYSKYSRVLQEELQPELLIFIPETSSVCEENNQNQESAVQGTPNGVVAEKVSVEVPKEGAQSNSEEKLKLVRVEYWLEKPDAGAFFLDNMFHTSDQLQRARCWFPCVDSQFQRCSYEMEFTVDSQYIAVSCGNLLYQVINKEGEHLKTYVYSLEIPVTARCVSLVVAPLEVYPERQNLSISHFCLPGNALQLQCTMNFFHSVFSCYEDYLGAPFPFGSYSHVFLNSEFTLTSVSVGAAMTIVDSNLLVDERTIDQTIDTRIKLAHALARQWFGVYITPESSDDVWILEGLCGFLTDMFIKRHFGNNETYYRRYKANEAVCKVDIYGAPPLSPHMDLHGTEAFGILGHIHKWKAVATIHMLEKQMGPEAFRKILQRITLRAQGTARNSRTLSTKEFRHFANKIGNLERPFLKEFFLRWVESPGCPVLRMGFEYSKRRNMIELAVHRSCTAFSDSHTQQRGDVFSERPRAADMGWPGMMSIRVHEIDGTYDHPSLSMAGDTYQILEIQCHSKLSAARRIQRPKKGNKPDGLEDTDMGPIMESRQSTESPLLWIRADPQMEYLAEIHLHQPEQMWINQLEKDKDVTAQLQAISALSCFPHMSFATVNSLSACLADSKIFYKVRIEAAYGLAGSVIEENGVNGLSQLLSFYKSVRYDADMGLPRPNDFQDLAEYFVLEVIPDAISNVRDSDGRSPLEAVEFVYQLLKHNDNSGNQYSDVFWLSSIIRSIGNLEFGQQSLDLLSRMLKHIDRFLQYDRIMPSYNHLITISCIQTLTKLALRFSSAVPLDRFERILLPFRDSRTMPFKVRAAVLLALLELEIHIKGLDAGINLALHLIDTDPSVRVQGKIFSYLLHASTLMEDSRSHVQTKTLFKLIQLLQNKRAFNNTILRHTIFCIVQVLAGRQATLFRTGRRDVNRKVVPKTVESKIDASRPKSAPSCSATSSEDESDQKQESDRKIGVLKFKIKPTSSIQDVHENARKEVLGVAPTSSVSVDMCTKKEITVESPHSIKHTDYEDMHPKEESGIDRIEILEGPSSPNVSKNGIVVQENDNHEVSEHHMSDIETMPNKVSLDGSMSVCEKENQADFADSIDHYTQELSLPDDKAHDPSIVKQEEDESSRVEMGRDENAAVSHKKKKRTDEEKKEKSKKRDREKERHKDGNSHEKRYDKHNDPEYREKKRLKKEKRRERERQQLLEQQQQEQIVSTNEPEMSNAGLDSSQPRAPEKVFRLKIVNKGQMDG